MIHNTSKETDFVRICAKDKVSHHLQVKLKHVFSISLDCSAHTEENWLESVLM